MDNNEIKPIVITGYKEESAPVVYKSAGVKSNDDEPVVLKKKKTHVRELVIEPTKTDTKKVRLKELSNNLVSCFKNNGYLMNEKRAKAFISAMLSGRLLFLNHKDIEKLDIIYKFFGSMKNVADKNDLKHFNGSDTLKAIYQARYNRDTVYILTIKADDDNDLKLFEGLIENPYEYNSVKVDVTINNKPYTRITLPENLWIFVICDNDHNLKLRKYGSYAKLSLLEAEKEISPYLIPSYSSFKEAFLDTHEINENIWNYIDELTSLLKDSGYDFTNRELNMIDDYLVSLLELELDYKDAIDFLIVNKILYITGDDAIKALAKFSLINDLKHSKKKLEGVI